MSIQKTSDAKAALLFIAIGLAFGATSIIYLPIGTVLEMGPGYFPLVVSAILAVIGLVLLAGALITRSKQPLINGPENSVSSFSWRGTLLVLAFPLLFALVVNRGGLIPAVFISTFVSSFASSAATPLRALIVAAALTACCTLIFSYGLGLPIALIGR